MEKRRQGSFTKGIVVRLLGRISVVGSDRAGLPGSTRGTGSAPRQGNSRSSSDSWTAVERSVSVKVPQEFTELLDSTPNGKWTIMDDGTHRLSFIKELRL